MGKRGGWGWGDGGGGGEKNTALICSRTVFAPRRTRAQAHGPSAIRCLTTQARLRYFKMTQ